MTCHQCLSGHPCDYALSIGDSIAKKKVALMHAERDERDGIRSANRERENLVAARNELLAHERGGIPPEAQEFRCSICGGLGHECPPENHNERYGT